MRLFDVLQTRGYHAQRQTQKRTPLRVGTDIMPLREPTKAGPSRDTVSIDDNASLIQNATSRFSQTHYNSTKSLESHGYQISVSPGTGNGANTIIFSREGQEDIILNFKGDARLSFDSDGSPKIEELRSSEAKLSATANDQILIRTSGRDVDTGNYSTTVLNTSSKKGEFSSGTGKTTFLGSYTDSTINGGAGRNDFAGTFENCQINGGSGENEFSGMFSASELNGGISADLFSGIFLNMSAINGGDGDDSFTGTFFDSTIDGGAGNDTYGKIRLADARERGKDWDGFVADVNFWNSTITDSEGDDRLEAVVKGGTVDLGSGNDVLTGAFVETNVTGGGGDNVINAFYAESANFIGGSGKETIKVATAINSRVQGGSGESAISLGLAETDAAGWGLSIENGGAVSMAGKRWGRDVRRDFDYESKDFGYQSGSFVDAGEGEATVDITVDGVTTLFEKMEILKDEESEEEKNANAVSTSGEKLIDKTGANASSAGVNSAPVGESVYKPDDSALAAPSSGDSRNASYAGAVADESSSLPELSLEERVAALILSSSDKGYSTEFDGVMVSLGDDHIFSLNGSAERNRNFAWLNDEVADKATRRRAFSAYML